jgi:2-keto-4-pentenoate hydratase/2-oxohepta-3-ene-1,7-dioic acid hydratase in catechol pathway
MKPGKIVCVGRNYREHAKELGNEVPAEPLLFLKPPSSIIASGDTILLPGASSRVEFEGEIGLVIGTTLRSAAEDEAGAGIRGLVALNDVTARDLQRRDNQWTRAKGFDTFCPVGPEWKGTPDWGTLEIITRVNGKERQKAPASDMVFSPAMLLSYISNIMTLEPGDVVATGTPAGVGPLEEGDEVQVEIPGISSVTNRVARR